MEVTPELEKDAMLEALPAPPDDEAPVESRSSSPVDWLVDVGCELIILVEAGAIAAVEGGGSAPSPFDCFCGAGMDGPAD